MAIDFFIGDVRGIDHENIQGPLDLEHATYDDLRPTGEKIIHIQINEKEYKDYYRATTYHYGVRFRRYSEVSLKFWFWECPGEILPDAIIQIQSIINAYTHNKLASLPCETLFIGNSGPELIRFIFNNPSYREDVKRTDPLLVIHEDHGYPIKRGLLYYTDLVKLDKALSKAIAYCTPTEYLSRNELLQEPSFDDLRVTR